MFLDDAGTTLTASEQIKAFVNSILGSVSGTITLTDIAAIVGVIIAATLIIYFAWIFGRKGYNALIGVLRGKRAKM